MSAPNMVLITGASGFVGSHILDELQARGMATRLLLRTASRTEFIDSHLQNVELRFGALDKPETLRKSLEGISHIIHCAGCTKALRATDYYEANQAGTRHLVEAINRPGGTIRRLVHISSLAAAHPADAQAPAREDDPPAPVSEYGRSKLAAEREVRVSCSAEFTILRPSAVYGPRDRDFLLLFKTVRSRLVPSFGGGRQPLNLAYVKDLARVAVDCLTHGVAAAQTYNVASKELVTAAGLAGEIARQMSVRPLYLPVPAAALWSACLVQDVFSRITRRPHILSRDKYSELRAPGWVCDTNRLRNELGQSGFTPLRDGIAETLEWYRKNKWL